jgi:Tfp pilus assembly protein PilF/predicted aspartyl protease
VEVTPLEAALDLLRDGEFSEAGDAYNKIIASGKDLPAAYAGLARVYLHEKNVLAADVAARKAVALDPKFQDGHVALGEVYFREGNLPDAEKEWIAVADSGHATARAYLGLHRIALATSNYKSAMIRIDRAHQLDPVDPDIWHEWVSTLTRDDRVKELKEYMARRITDPRELERMSEYVELLEDESKQPTRTCELTSVPQTTETKFEQVLYGAEYLRGYGLNVKLNGMTSRLMLDTGTAGIVVDRRVAEKAGVTHIADARTRGFGDNGDVQGYLGYVKSIQVAGLEFHDCYIKVYGRRSVQGDDGLIGTNIFSHFLVDLDFPEQKMKLSALPPEPSAPPTPTAPVKLQPDQIDVSALHDRYVAPEMQSYTPVYRFGHMLLIPTSVNDSPAKLFLIDTGGWDNMVAPQFARETSRVHQAGDITVTGLSGEVKKVYTVDHAKIRFASFQQDRENLIAVDLSPISNDVGAEISGTLGFAMLSMLDMRIDYRDGLVDFVYDKKRFH